MNEQLKLTIECDPKDYETLSAHYNQITPIEDRLKYTLDEFMTDILIEEAKRIKEEYKYKDDNETSKD